MYKCVLLVCLGSLLANLGTARPDLSLGYRYNQGTSSGGGSFLTAPIDSSYSPTASGNNYFNVAPSVGPAGPQTIYYGGGGGVGVGGGGASTSSSASSSASAGAGGSGGGFYGFGGNGLNTQYTASSSAQSQANYAQHQSYLYNQAPIITKHFYVHSAPEDHDEQQIVRYINVGRPQKNYRVVFIDAPTSTASKAKIIANVAPVEDKTAIYVLSKKSNALDVSAEVVTPTPVYHKPDVFFIKYKTPQEAIHAQHTVQAQYDALGGTSEITQEGTVPVTSVIGSLGGGHDVSDASSSSVTTSGGGGGNVDVSVDQNGGSGVPVTQNTDNTNQVYLPSHQRF